MSDDEKPVYLRADDEVQVTLTGRNVRMLRRALRYHAAKLRRDLNKSTFVPEPGKTDVTAANYMHASELLELLNRLDPEEPR